MADKHYRSNTLANWKAWVRNGVERGAAVAARRGRFLDALPDNHPSLEGVAPDDRADFSRRLHAAAKGA